MKDDEIKEILDFKENADYKRLSCDEIAILKNYITNLQQENEQLRTQVNTYENPDDLTLFYMWLDEEAKDKMRHMENEIRELKQFNQMLIEIGEDYKSRCEKAIEYIDIETNKGIYESGYGRGTALTICKEHLLKILNGRSDE